MLRERQERQRRRASAGGGRNAILRSAVQEGLLENVIREANQAGRWNLWGWGKSSPDSGNPMCKSPEPMELQEQQGAPGGWGWGAGSRQEVVGQRGTDQMERSVLTHVRSSTYPLQWGKVAGVVLGWAEQWLESRSHESLRLPSWGRRGRDKGTGRNWKNWKRQRNWKTCGRYDSGLGWIPSPRSRGQAGGAAERQWPGSDSICSKILF